MKLKSALTTLVMIMLTAGGSSAASDDVNVSHYHIMVSKVDFSAKRIHGRTDIDFRIEKSLDTLELDLCGLTVDSIQGENIQGFYQSGEKLNVVFSQKLNVGHTSAISIFYQGSPKTDASWGGFYFSGNYAFNLGVGFSSDPHNLGRVWFPCRDNFTDKASFSFAITVPDGYKALCNGELDSISGNTWHWRLNEQIPTYLASMAVAPYCIHKDQHKNTEITLACLPADSLKMIASFAHLKDALDAFEARYGVHRFKRAGFNAVPFNAGAMEHATNIAYPNYAVDGTLNSETLMAHELAHHWWGNNVTCSDHTQMWLNEGWASYSERIFLEWVYGREKYLEDVSNNHRGVLHYAHLRDGKAWPVSGVDHARTYGAHVYDKGADMAHTLRGYMGDTAFFKACASFMTEFEFKNANTADLKNTFQKFTSLPLDDFFRFWIEQPGSMAFNIFEWNAKDNGGGKFWVTMRVKQNLRMAPELYRNVPYEITFMDAGFRSETKTVLLSGLDTTFVIEVNFKPAFVALDMNQKLSDAITDKHLIVREKGAHDFGDALMTMNVENIKDSAMVRVEHFWTAADRYYMQQLPGLVLNPQRYWQVDGIWDENFKASATIEYNGRVSGTSYASGYLDNELEILHEDSLVLLYRPFPFSMWQIEQNVVRNGGTPLDRKGQMTINSLKKGQYAWAVYNQKKVGVEEKENQIALRIFPNPSKGEISFNFPVLDEDACLEIVDVRGVAVKKIKLNKGSEQYLLREKSLTPGIYWAGISLGNKAYQPVKFIVQ